MRIAILALAVLSLVACSQPGAVPAAQTYAGCYFSGEEQSEFRPRGTQEMWWLRGDLGEALGPSAIPAPGQFMRGRSVFLVVQGQLSGQGHYGHMGQYTRTLTVLRVVSARAPSPQDGCLF